MTEAKDATGKKKLSIGKKAAIGGGLVLGVYLLTRPGAPLGGVADAGPSAADSSAGGGVGGSDGLFSGTGGSKDSIATTGGDTTTKKTAATYPCSDVGAGWTGAGGTPDYANCAPPSGAGAAAPAASRAGGTGAPGGSPSFAGSLNEAALNPNTLAGVIPSYYAVKSIRAASTTARAATAARDAATASEARAAMARAANAGRTAARAGAANTLAEADATAAANAARIRAVEAETLAARARSAASIGGSGPLIGAALAGGQAIFQGVGDIQAQARGEGPYGAQERNIKPGATITAATANVAAGTAVGAGSLGLASLDFNKGVYFLGLPIVTTPKAGSGRSCLFGSSFCF